jgi:hypothetical protein
LDLVHQRLVKERTRQSKISVRHISLPVEVA